MGLCGVLLVLNYRALVYPGMYVLLGLDWSILSVLLYFCVTDNMAFTNLLTTTNLGR